MADKRIKAGSVVKLKSGGPEMTVALLSIYNTGTDDADAVCYWFDKDQKILSQKIPTEALMYIEG